MQKLRGSDGPKGTQKFPGEGSNPYIPRLCSNHHLYTALCTSRTSVVYSIAQ